jgi:hypothetical protein
MGEIYDGKTGILLVIIPIFAVISAGDLFKSPPQSPSHPVPERAEAGELENGIHLAR